MMTTPLVLLERNPILRIEAGQVLVFNGRSDSDAPTFSRLEGQLDSWPCWSSQVFFR
jgi:hypothetical protein